MWSNLPQIWHYGFGPKFLVPCFLGGVKDGCGWPWGFLRMLPKDVRLRVCTKNLVVSFSKICFGQNKQ